MSAANALLAAIHARLSGDATLAALIGAGGILDRLLPRPVLPCIVVGGMETRDYSTATEAGEEHPLTLRCGRSPGRREAEEISGWVRALLQDAALVLDGQVLVSLAHERTRTRRQARMGYFTTGLRFREVTE
ncbi:hypothetical protein ABID21_000044 [Pseudorhizobium tarimense]|uniref:DUF3168 domain-containing protein n=1 Tax=Pseudorhizobium tarimense TaxID=1079109 RepID=A0ABV2H0K9_9HYPH|nr:DUF3168 domain-containing protein [Pseudorhizobium tarimense]MCJ8517305.1 DUF3168 domain-containing protein [Pseudorhizobium tarimense]